MPRLPMPSDTEAFAEKTRAAVRHILPHGGHGGTVERRHTACLRDGVKITSRFAFTVGVPSSSTVARVFQKQSACSS